jgi:hypothetical protein
MDATHEDECLGSAFVVASAMNAATKNSTVSVVDIERTLTGLLVPAGPRPSATRLSIPRGGHPDSAANVDHQHH